MGATAVVDDIADYVWVSSKKAIHNVFLSHSGAQKNFVDQLCVDLIRVGQTPFFDKRSLSKGEEFAQQIITATQECELAVVVISEEYFSRSKWPMLELAAIVQAQSKPRILPLFLGLSCKEFKKPKRRERWFRLWEEWSMSDNRVCVSVWKSALQELEGRTGMEYVKAIGEVPYRRDIVSTICGMMLHVEVVGQQFFTLDNVALGITTQSSFSNSTAVFPSGIGVRFSLPSTCHPGLHIK